MFTITSIKLLIKIKQINKYFYCLLEPAIEWRILGQEQNGSLLASFISIPNENSQPRTHIGIYSPIKKSFDVLHSFEGKENVIQASVNHSQTLLAYVTKDDEPTKDEDTLSTQVYTPFIVEINHSNAKGAVKLLEMKRQKQVMVQFLWRKQSTFEKNYQDKFLVFIHEECKCVAFS